jgi:hypothetical protein
LRNISAGLLLKFTLGDFADQPYSGLNIANPAETGNRRGIQEIERKKGFNSNSKTKR